MSDFKSSWIPKDTKEGVLSRVGKALRSEEPLKPRLEQAQRKIKIQVSRLDGALRKLGEKDKRVFRRVVSAMKQHQKAKAAILATELVELRKLEKKIEQSKLALEQISLRIETATQMGDIASILTPATGVIRSVGSGLGGVIPEGDRAMTDISDMLNGILLDAGMAGGNTVNFQAANSEAERILDEASSVVEQRMQEHLPEIPAEITLNSRGRGAITA